MDDDAHDDAHDDVLYRHLLLPKTENVKEIYISSVKVLLVCHPKGLFLFQKFKKLISKIKHHEHTKICNQRLTRWTRRN